MEWRSGQTVIFRRTFIMVEQELIGAKPKGCDQSSNGNQL